MIKSLKDFWNNRVTVSDEVVFERSLLLCDPMEDMEFISSVWWCWWWEWCVSRCEWRIALTNFRHHHRQGGRALFWTSIIFFLDFDVWHPPQKKNTKIPQILDNLHKISLSKKIRVGEEALSFLLLSPIIVAPSCSFSFSSSYSHSYCSYCHVSAHHQYAFI